MPRLLPVAGLLAASAVASAQAGAFVAPPASSASRTSHPSARPIHGNRYRRRQLYTTSQRQSEPKVDTDHASGRRWKRRRKRKSFLPPPVREVSKYEERALAAQLGYVPPNVCRVAARSGDADDGSPMGSAGGVGGGEIDVSGGGIGRPIAIQSYPLLVQLPPNSHANANFNNRHPTSNHDGRDVHLEGGMDRYHGCTITPFPTTYWLTDPHVSRALSELERSGHVRQFQSKLENDADLARRWWNCHEQYAIERWELLSPADREWLLQRSGDVAEDGKREGMYEMVMRSGVAGTDHRGLRGGRTDEDANDHLGGGDATEVCVPSVKCLHSHYAHYRSQLSKYHSDASAAEEVEWNIVGEWTHGLLLEQFPELIL